MKFNGIQWGLVVGAAWVTILSGGATCQATTFTVNTTSDVDGGTACSLRNAITAANRNMPYGGCSAGSSGAIDTIILSNQTYNINNSEGPLGALSDVTIEGFSSGGSVIVGSVAAGTIFNVNVSLVGSVKLEYLTYRAVRGYTAVQLMSPQTLVLNSTTA